MKIVFLAPFGIRPKGTVIARMLPLAVELQKIGHTVTIIAPPYTNPEDSGKTEIVRGVRLVNVALPATGKALSALPLSWRMFRAALAEKPDLVHLFKPKGYGGLAAMLMLSLSRLGLRMPPLFLDTDDWEGAGGMNDLLLYSSAEKRLFAFQEKWLSRNVAGVTVASRELEKLTAGLGVLKSRIMYLPNCVEPKSEGDGKIIRERLGITPETQVLLLYTRFFEFTQERLHLLFAEIHRLDPELRLLVVGKGRNREEDLLLKAADRMGFREALTVIGWVEPEEIPDYLSAADMAVYLLDDTLLNRAKCPAKLTELLMAGLPVVADNTGQAAEYIVSGKTGILCHPGNWREMSDHVSELSKFRRRAHNLGESGKKYLHEKFNWKKYAGKLHFFYRGLTIQ
jgi:glycosyltransferase involved in cell wall biosynthesis